MMRNKEKKEAATADRRSQKELQLWEMQAELCQMLANPKRLQIINLLKWGENSVGSLVQSLGVAKANLSQHLAVMRQKGILATRRDGTTIYYRLAFPHITEACEVMREVLLETLSSREQFSRSLLEGSGPAGTEAGEEEPED